MVRLTKIAINPESQMKIAESLDDYNIDQERGTWGQFFEGKSPPVDFTFEGDAFESPREGERFGVMNQWGKYVWTSTVRKIEKDGDITYITTINSLYKMEVI
jgi:hypothetical protein